MWQYWEALPFSGALYSQSASECILQYYKRVWQVSKGRWPGCEGKARLTYSAQICQKIRKGSMNGLDRHLFWMLQAAVIFSIWVQIPIMWLKSSISERKKYPLVCDLTWIQQELVVLTEMPWNHVPLNNSSSEALQCNKIEDFLDLSMNQLNSIKTEHVENPVGRTEIEITWGSVKARQHSFSQVSKTIKVNTNILRWWKYLLFYQVEEQ